MRRTVIWMSMLLSFVAWAEVPKAEVPALDDCTRVRGYACVSVEVVELYDTLRELSLEEQRQQTWALPPETKAALWRYNLELYLREHPELGQNERAILREGIALVLTRGWFEARPDTPEYQAHQRALEEHKTRAAILFDPLTIQQVFLRLGPEPQPIASLPLEPPYVASPGTRKMEASLRPAKPIVPNVWRTCSCNSWYECWYHGAGVDCYDSYCDPVRHCGWYNSEVCWGNCKQG